MPTTSSSITSRTTAKVATVCPENTHERRTDRKKHATVTEEQRTVAVTEGQIDHSAEKIFVVVCIAVYKFWVPRRQHGAGNRKEAGVEKGEG